MNTDVERFTDLVAERENFHLKISHLWSQKKDEARSSAGSNGGWVMKGMRIGEERMKCRKVSFSGTRLLAWQEAECPLEVCTYKFKVKLAPLCTLLQEHLYS